MPVEMCPLCLSMYARLSQHLVITHKVQNKEERKLLLAIGSGRINARVGKCPVAGCGKFSNRLDRHIHTHSELSLLAQDKALQRCKRWEVIMKLTALRASDPDVAMVSTLDLEENSQPEDADVPPSDEVIEEAECKSTGCKWQKDILQAQVADLNKQVDVLTESLHNITRRYRVLKRRSASLGAQKLHSSLEPEVDLQRTSIASHDKFTHSSGDRLKMLKVMCHDFRKADKFYVTDVSVQHRRLCESALEGPESSPPRQATPKKRKRPTEKVRADKKPAPKFPELTSGNTTLEETEVQYQESRTSTLKSCKTGAEDPIETGKEAAVTEGGGEGVVERVVDGGTGESPQLTTPLKKFPKSPELTSGSTTLEETEVQYQESRMITLESCKIEVEDPVEIGQEAAVTEGGGEGVVEGVVDGGTGESPQSTTPLMKFPKSPELTSGSTTLEETEVQYQESRMFTLESCKIEAEDPVETGQEAAVTEGGGEGVVEGVVDGGTGESPQSTTPLMKFPKSPELTSGSTTLEETEVQYQESRMFTLESCKIEAEDPVETGQEAAVTEGGGEGVVEGVVDGGTGESPQSATPLMKFPKSPELTSGSTTLEETEVQYQESRMFTLESCKIEAEDPVETGQEAAVTEGVGEGMAGGVVDGGTGESPQSTTPLMKFPTRMGSLRVVLTPIKSAVMSTLTHRNISPLKINSVVSLSSTTKKSILYC